MADSHPCFVILSSALFIGGQLKKEQLVRKINNAQFKNSLSNTLFFQPPRGYYREKVMILGFLLGQNNLRKFRLAQISATIYSGSRIKLEQT